MQMKLAAVVSFQFWLSLRMGEKSMKLKRFQSIVNVEGSWSFLSKWKEVMIEKTLKN